MTDVVAHPFPHYDGVPARLEDRRQLELKEKVRMLRLFKLHPRGEDPIYFDNMRLAKRKRDVLIEEDPARHVTVRRGPDHWKGETFDGAHTGRM